MKKILPTLLALALLFPSTLLAQSDENSTTWSEYGAGIDPVSQDWTKQRITGWCDDGNREVVELQAAITDGLVLNNQYEDLVSGIHRCILVWDESNASLNSEGLTAGRFTSSGTGFNMRIGISLRQQSGTDNSYVATFSLNGSLNLWESTSSGLNLIASGSSTISVDTWYWIRFRVTDNDLMMRVWENGTEEPDTWDLEDTDTNIQTAGHAGLYLNLSEDSARISYIDNFAFSNNPITSPPCFFECPGTGAIPEPGRFPIMSYDWVGELGPFAVFLLIIVAAVATTGILTAFGVPLYVTMPLAAIVGLTSVIITIAPLWILFAGMFLIGLLGLLLLMRQRSRSE